MHTMYRKLKGNIQILQNQNKLASSFPQPYYCRGWRCTSGNLSFTENVNVLYKYLRVLGSHKVNPLIVPSVVLHNILVNV